jgi:hypothetical protein
MKCECGRLRYKTRILHINKKDYSIKECLGCGKERELEEIVKSTVSNQYFLKGKNQDEK